MIRTDARRPLPHSYRPGDRVCVRAHPEDRCGVVVRVVLDFDSDRYQGFNIRCLIRMRNGDPDTWVNDNNLYGERYDTKVPV